MTATLLPNAKQQFLDSNGRPLAGGQIYFYIPNTSTPKNTWQDAGETVLNTNPVVLDANGQAIIYGDGQYRQVVYDVHGNLIWDRLTSSYVSQADLSSTTDPGSGAGAIGFNYSLTYAAGTVGKWLKDLANSAGSSFIGFLQAGTGAILRTIQAELLEQVKVTQFGADPSGVGDSTAAIQKAFDYAATFTNGLNVIFPSGTYLVTDTLSVLCDKVGMIGNGACIQASGFSINKVLFSVSHSITTIFPSFKQLKIEGLKLKSANRNGICFSVVGNGIDRFSAHIHYALLDIQNFNIAFKYGDYAFAPMVTNCSVANSNQVFKQVGTTSTGAHFVFDKCLFTTIASASLTLPAFDFGTVNTYKFSNCDIESSEYTLMTTNGSDVYLNNCHMELDVGAAGGASLFVNINTDYGHFVFAECTMFIWQSTSNVPPFFTVADRMASFVINNSRVVVNSGITPASNTFLSNYFHPFLCNKAITVKGPMNPKTGQAFLYSSPNNNGFTNWGFSSAISTDFTTGGGGVTAVSDVPYGSAKCMDMGFSAFSASAMIPVPDNAQMGMITFWGKTTIFVSGQMSLEVRLYNANSVQTDLFVVNITNVGINQWDRFQIDTLSNISNKGTKFVKITFSCPGTVAYRVAYPFIDFA